MMKPFSTREMVTEGNELQRRKMKYFNKKLSGAHTEMTENVYALLKRRWQILKNMTLHVPRAVKAIKACAILHNICVDWKDEIPEEDDQRPDTEDAGDIEGERRVMNDSDYTRKMRGRAKRRRVMNEMNFPF